MALCESNLDSVPSLKREENTTDIKKSPEQMKMETNGDIYQVPGGVPLSVDYRSPVSHFVPPAVEMYAARNKPGPVSTQSSNTSSTPIKRKRGRPRVDKNSPEYLANLAARQQAREMAAMMNSSMNSSSESGEKRKRGRPRVDKTSPEYLARKRARELEALERKAKKEYRRRTGQESPASSTGDTTPRVKRKYTKRTPSKNDGTQQGDRVKGKRGRPRKTDGIMNRQQMPKIRVRSNLMPDSEPISLDSDEEPDLGSPSQASDSLSLDENLRALRHIHEKYANLDKDDMYSAHMVSVNFKKPNAGKDDDVLSVRSSEGGASVKELETRVEKLEDSSNSDSDSSSSGSGSSSSGSSSSDSSSSSESSDDEVDKPASPPLNNDSSSFGAWSMEPPSSESEDPERAAVAPPPAADDVSCSDNESPDKSYQCHICTKWFSTRVTLKIHRRSHQNRGGGGGRTRSSDRYECDMCSETFNRRDKLLEHKAEAHRGAMTVRCEVCRKCFEDDAELVAHDRTHTDDDRAGRCSSCGAEFPTFEQLSRHLSSAHGSGRAPHACIQCGKRFSHLHSLTRHMHNHARQLYRCVVCKASFARADQLAQHLNSHLANYKRLKP